MRFVRIITLLAVASLLAGCNPTAPAGNANNASSNVGGSAADPLVYIADDDTEMAKAIAEARARLPEFWSHYENPMSETDFSLKLEVTDANGTEFFWCIPIEKRDGKIFGTIDNDPGIVKSVKYGDTVEIPPERIADWTYMKNGKIHGNFTMRPLLKQMPPEEAAEYRAMLAEP